MKYLCVIQSRLYSKRFPSKVMQLVNGRTMVKSVTERAYYKPEQGLVDIKEVAND